METLLSIPLVNLATLTGMMTLGWIFSVLHRNVTIVDSLWGLGFVLVAATTFWMGSGFSGRSLLILILTSAWGLRLCVYLTWRNWGQAEDHRYGVWRKKSGSSFWMVSLFKVFWLQAIFLWVISLVLLRMTGVPLTEAALKKRRPGYAEYIRKTSTFFPRPPRKEAT